MVYINEEEKVAQFVYTRPKEEEQHDESGVEDVGIHSSMLGAYFLPGGHIVLGKDKEGVVDIDIHYHVTGKKNSLADCEVTFHLKGAWS